VQRHVLRSIHDAVEIVRAGVIGKISEVHSWVGGSRGMPDKPKVFPARPRDTEMGPMARAGRRTSVCTGVCSLRMALLVGFRHRRNRQLGLPYLGYSVLGVEPHVSFPSRSQRPGG
jgi:hypothetical protein